MMLMFLWGMTGTIEVNRLMLYSQGVIHAREKKK